MHSASTGYDQDPVLQYDKCIWISVARKAPNSRTDSGEDDFEVSSWIALSALRVSPSLTIYVLKGYRVKSSPDIMESASLVCPPFESSVNTCPWVIELIELT